MSGAYGKAWRSLACERIESCLSLFLIERHTSQSPWTRWTVRLIDLRGLSRTPSTHHALAKYELSVSAIDPRRPPDPDDGPFACLIPPDLVYQFHGIDDDRARRVLEYYVDAVVNLGTNMDADYASWWGIVLGRAVADLRVHGVLSPP